MDDPIPLLNILVPVITSVLGVLLGIASAFLTYRQKNKELEQQFSAQKDQLRLLKEQVQDQHLKMESDLEQVRKANQSPEDQAASIVSLLPVPPLDENAEYWPHRSPYIVGLPISDPSHYFRNKDQARDFYGRVLGPQLNCLAIYGARRSGKTSFINLVCHPSIHQQYLTPAETRNLVMVNLNLQSGITSPELFFRYLVLKTFEAVQRHADPCETHVNLPAAINEQYVASFFKELLKKGWKIILILDEFEKMGNSSSFNIPFFDFLRSLSNDSDGKIVWVTTSYLRIDKVQPNEGHQPCSAFFNLFSQEIFLGSLSHAEARKLICEPPALENNMEYQKEDVDFLIRLAGLMPFPLQAVASLLYHNYVQEKKGPGAHQEIEQLFSKNMDKFYAHDWYRFEQHEQKVLKKITYEKSIDEDENSTVLSLISHGFLRDLKTISGEAFRDWIRSHHSL